MRSIIIYAICVILFGILVWVITFLIRRWKSVFDSEAFNVGMVIENVKDYSEAIKWYRRAVAKGDANAEAQIAYLYEHGLGVSQDYQEAMK